jgi:hypothetical protein
MSRFSVTIKTIGCVFVLFSSFAQAETEKINVGQRAVSEAIAQWTKCINTELTEKIQFIASPSYIAEQILEQCDERYLK